MPAVSMTRLYAVIFGEPPLAMTPQEAADWLDRLGRVLDTLSPREAFVVRERYLRDSRRTLAQLGDVLHVGRSRVGQIESSALRRLRHPSRRRFLAGQGRLLAPPWSVRTSSNPAPAPCATGSTAMPAELEERLVILLRDLDLSVRVLFRLERGGLRFVGDLVCKSEGDLIRIPYVGRRALREIKEVLGLLGLGLGMRVPGWARMKAGATWRRRDDAPPPQSGGGRPAIAEDACPGGCPPDGGSDGR